MKRTIALGIFIGLIPAIQSQDFFGNMREAYVISPSIAVSSAMVTNFDWDTSGKLLMYQQVPWTINLLAPDQKPLQKVCIWNSQTQTSKVVLDSLEPGSDCNWMGSLIAIYRQTSTQVIDPISQKSITFGKDTELLVGPERGFDRFVVRKGAAIFSTKGINATNARSDKS